MKRTYILLTAVLAALLLVGCNGINPENPTTEPGSTPAATTQPTTAATEPSTETTAPAETQGGADEAPITGDTTPADVPTQPTTAPTQPATQPTTAPTQPATQPTTQPTTAPTEPTAAPTQPPAAELSEYEAFRQMSPADQQKYMESFESVEAFFNWYNRVKQEYEDANPPIEIGGDGSVDLEDILGGK